MNWHDIWLNFFNYPGSHANLIPWYMDLIRDVIRVLISVMFILLLVPPLVWFERRLLGFMQQRQGPNRVGPGGILQTIADGIKLLMKEDIIPTDVDKTLYILAPIVMLIPALITCGVVPWNGSRIWGASAPNANIGILYVLAFASLGVYGVVMAGWSSNNKYALLGGLRSSAQMISYEIGMGLSIVTVVLLSGSLGMLNIVGDQSAYWGTQAMLHYGIGIPQWHLLQFFPMGFVATIIYMISGVAETNRAPFDLPEAETELIAGYHIEYTSMKFAMFFMGEYANMIAICAIGITLFFGGYEGLIPWLNQVPAAIAHGFHAIGIDWLTFALNAVIPAITLVVKIILGLYFFIWLRATLPRLRYDMLMEFGWKGLLPISLGNILCLAIALTFGYVTGLVLWIVVAVIALIVVANLRSTQHFAEKTRRSSKLQMFSEAQPFIAVNESNSRGSSGGSSRPIEAPDASDSTSVALEEKV